MKRVDNRKPNGPPAAIPTNQDITNKFHLGNDMALMEDDEYLAVQPGRTSRQMLERQQAAASAAN